MDHVPDITESDPRRQITVDWDLSDKPVPYCTWVTITTEFVLPAWNAIEYEDVRFTYPDKTGFAHLPFLKWEMETPYIMNADTILNVTGGYVVGSFNVEDPRLSPDERTMVEYRFIHQYSYNQTPEDHVLFLMGDSTYAATDIRIGHSYGYLDTQGLWDFKDWMTDLSDTTYLFAEKPLEIVIDWEGRLPYPEGEDIRGRIREIEPKE